MSTTITSMQRDTRIAIQAHILDGFGSDYGYPVDSDPIANLRDQLDALIWGTRTYKDASRDLVEGGKYLVYYHDIRAWLNGLGINDTNVEYDDQAVWDKYIALITREINALLLHGKVQPLHLGNTYHGRIIHLERMRSSVNGNPRFRVTFQTDDGSIYVWRTRSDSSFGYQVQNELNKHGWLIVSERGIITDWSREWEAKS